MILLLVHSRALFTRILITNVIGIGAMAFPYGDSETHTLAKRLVPNHSKAQLSETCVCAITIIVIWDRISGVLNHISWCKSGTYV